MNSSLQEIIKHFNLQAHPEGGYFRETYRSSLTLQSENLEKIYKGSRQSSTAIYYLLPQGQKSRFHRLKTDELMHFYLGECLQIIEITPSGNLTVTSLGQKFAKGEVPQHRIVAGNWFGAVCAAHSEYALIGCTVAPAFDFKDFEIADRNKLIQDFPQHQNWILRLTD